MKKTVILSLLVTLSFLAIGAIVDSRADAQILRNQPFSTQVSFVAGDATKTLVAAPGAGRTLIITYVNCTITTSAAQTIDIDNGASVDIIKLAVSPAVNSSYTVGPLDLGISLGANVPLQYTPGAAGNAGNCVSEGYVTTTGQ